MALEEVEVVLKAVEAVVYTLKLVNGAQCALWVLVHTLHTVQYHEDCGGRALFARDATLRAVSCTPYAGGR